MNLNGIISKRSRERLENSKRTKKIQKNLKKVLDKAKHLCYYKQADAERPSRKYLEN